MFEWLKDWRQMTESYTTHVQASIEIPALHSRHSEGKMKIVQKKAL